MMVWHDESTGLWCAFRRNDGVVACFPNKDEAQDWMFRKGTE